MADARAASFVALLDYLNDFDAHFGSLLRANRAHVVQTQAQIADSAAQLARREPPERS